MEVGRVAIVEQAQENHIEKIQKIQDVKESNELVVDHNKYKEANDVSIDEDFNEVIIDNISFGFNIESEDFFIKIKKGDVVYKYPTDDMMRMKAMLLEEMKDKMKNISSLDKQYKIKI
jgi:predicted lipase